MPTPRKPKALKRLEGTYRADRDHGEPSLPKARDLDPPDSLISPEAVRLWEKLARILGPVRVLSEADLEMMGHYCNLHAKCVKLWQAGETPTAALLTQLRMMAGEFGLTPASRSKAAPVDGGQDSDPSEEFFSGPKLASSG